MGGMASTRFSFATPITADAVRSALRREVGRTRASERSIDIHASGRHVTVESMDPIAFVYALKVCRALGGTPERPRSRPLPAWTETPWIDLAWWRRVRLLVGPTQL